ncbi:MAG TPA: hypothetical protein V6C78_32205 [Crinalium sp.]
MMLQTAPQVFTTLIIGLLMAFAFQLLLTNLGIALGVTALAFRGKSNSQPSSGSLGGTMRTVGLAAGLGILITINVVLFAASFLSVRLSPVPDPLLGGILGIVIWSAYLLILTWISSTAVGSLAGSLFSSLTGGFRAVVSTIKAALASKEEESEPEFTEAAIAQTVRQEVKATLDAADLRGLVETYLKDVQPPEPDLDVIRRDLEALLVDPSLRIAGTPTVDRQTFVELLGDRTNLSQRNIEHVVDQLEDVWQKVIAQRPKADLNAELLRYLQNADPEELQFDHLITKLENLLTPETLPTAEKNGVFAAIQTVDFKAALRTLSKRVDLSDLDVETIWHQLKAFKQQVLGSDSDSSQSTSSPLNIIKTDVEDYLLNAYPWNLERKTVQLEFENVIYDTDADPNQVRQQLDQLSRRDFVDILMQRDDLSEKKIHQIVDRLEAVRCEVLQKVQPEEPDDQPASLYSQVEHFFQSVQSVSLKPKTIRRTIRALLESAQADIESLIQTLGQFDRVTLQQLLKDRSHLGKKRINRTLDELEELRDRLIEELRSLPERIQVEIQEQWKKLDAYLLHTVSDRLTPKDVKRKLQNLFKDSLIDVLPSCASSFTPNREQLLSLLKRRQSLSLDAVHQIAEQVEETWHELLSSAEPSMDWANDRYHDTLTLLTDYLKKIDWADLNPADLKDILLHWMKAPKTEAIALGLLTTGTVRDLLLEQLHEHLQQQGLDEKQIRQILNRVQEVLRHLMHVPRRWATRSQPAPQDFATHLNDYLCYSDRSDLNSDALQRHFKRLLNDFQSDIWNDTLTDFEHLGDRVPQLQPSQLREILNQRDEQFDEAEVATILQSIELICNQWIEEQQSQHQSSEGLDAIRTKLQSYFETLNLPDINTDAIEQHLHKLLDIPQTGLDVLGHSLESALDRIALPTINGFSLDDVRDRLSQFNRDTLANLLQGRDDISQRLANRLMEQVEGTRDRLLDQIETLQEKTQTQMEALKQDAQRKAAATQKAAAIAAWWLFSITLTSGVTAAIAGYLAAT